MKHQQIILSSPLPSFAYIDKAFYGKDHWRGLCVSSWFKSLASHFFWASISAHKSGRKMILVTRLGGRQEPLASSKAAGCPPCKQASLLLAWESVVSLSSNAQ